MKKTRRLLALLLVCVFLATALPLAALAEETDGDELYTDADGADDFSAEEEAGEEDAPEEDSASAELSEEEEKEAAYHLLNNTGTGYFYYYRDHADKEFVLDAPIALQASAATLSSGVTRDFRDGVDCLRMTGMNAYADFSFSVEKEGLYAVNVQYKSIPSSGQDIDLSVAVDGQTPYDELNPAAVPLVWQDTLTDGKFRRDEEDNELRPTQTEVEKWTQAWLRDTTGQYAEPYLIFLTAGQHSLRLTIGEQPVYVASLTLGYPESAGTYEEYKAQFDGREDSARYFEVEAEYSTEKSSSMLYPTYDRSNPATTPNDPAAVRLNTIGGGNWGTQGDYITWTVQVENAGYYDVAMRVRQSINEGLTSYRALLVDGQVPFEEAMAIPFRYNLNWKVRTLGDGKTPIYLTAGEHTITLKVNAEEVSPILRDLNQVVLDLNTLYRKIIMITSVTPDIYQDYNLPENIPGLRAALADCADRLERMSADMKQINGSQGSKAYLFDEMAVMLRDFVKTPFSIAERLGNFKTEIESLGSLLLTLGDMPIELDKFYFIPAGGETPSGKCSFWESASFGFQAFIASFSSDYVEVKPRDEQNNANIQVWISTGRDQAQIIRRLIDDDFTAKTGTNVKLSITDTGTTLIQATLAGKGPHCALCITKDTPVNLAMRGGLVNLLDYGVEKKFDEYYESAWQPYWYLDGLYAIPETQTFNMMFYRTDIFKELGLSVPSTWEEFYRCIEVIQGSNLTVGMQETNSAAMGVSSAIEWFNMFLFQNGGTYFNDNMSATLFHEEVALNAFTTVVDLYKEYGLDRDVNFYNRFRSGELPLGITAYTQYNMLSYAAPEINGLWAFAPIPATKREDGTLSRAESSTGTACMMLNKAVKEGIDQEVYDFLNWWTSASVQGTYGVELEATMGPAMRYSPANLKAFEKIPWSSSERRMIQEQWKEIYDVREIPGNYYISRSLTSALRLSIDNDVSARRELLLYNEEINTEITRKRKEFHLE